jgi:hypothetical protein
VASSLNDPVWIRTCYIPDLHAAYEEIREAGLRDSDLPDGLLVLDNEYLYGDYGNDWAEVFLRLPLLPDDTGFHGDDPEREDDPSGGWEPKDDRYLPLYNASLHDKQVVYVIDEQALRSGLIKLIYIDIHGNTVWHNTIAPEDIPEYFEALYYMRGMLSRLIERCLGGDEYLLQPGAQLQYD